METVVRSVLIYFFLLIVVRLSGKRTLAQMTIFDFVLLLIISEATQQGLLGDDYSVTNALIAIITLVFLDIMLSLIKRRFPTLEKIIDGVPVMIIKDGKLLEDRLKKLRLDRSDILETARRQRGLERLDQIKHAVLEKSGGITIIPEELPPEELARKRP